MEDEQQEQTYPFTPDQMMRHTALGLASDACKHQGADAVVRAAEKYLAFLKAEPAKA